VFGIDGHFHLDRQVGVYCLLRPGGMEDRMVFFGMDPVMKVDMDTKYKYEGQQDLIIG